MDILLYILIGLTAVLLALVAVLLIRQGRLARGQESDFDRLAEELHRQQTASAGELSRLRMELDDSVGRSTERMAKVLTDNQRLMQEVTAEQLSRLDRRFASFALENEQKLEQVRQTTEQRLAAMQRQNAEKLDEMRGVVDEKLQRTLEERMTQSFRLVNERLEQVYKGLGEMQTLAAGVGDLKKVLSNVKTRGILGEIQLGSILREILAPEQYDENVATRPGSRGAGGVCSEAAQPGRQLYLPAHRCQVPWRCLCPASGRLREQRPGGGGGGGSGAALPGEAVGQGHP